MAAPEQYADDDLVELPSALDQPDTIAASPSGGLQAAAAERMKEWFAPATAPFRDKRPSAGTRSFLQGNGYKSGFDAPDKVPFFADIFSEKAGSAITNLENKKVNIPDFIKGAGLKAAAIGGQALDVEADPMGLALTAFPALRGTGKKAAEVFSNMAMKGLHKRTSKGIVKESLKSPQGMEAMQKFVSGSFGSKYKDAYGAFGKSLDEIASLPGNAGKTVDASSFAAQIRKAEETGDPIVAEIRKMAAQDPIILEILDDPTRASALSLREAQGLKTMIGKSKPMQRMLAGQGATPSGLNLGNMSSQLEQDIKRVWPEMSDVYSKYGSKVNDLDEISHYFDDPANVSYGFSKGVADKGGFQGSGRAAFERQMPEFKTMADIFKKKTNPNPFIKNPYVRKAANFTVGYGAARGAEAVIRKLFGNK